MRAAESVRSGEMVLGSGDATGQRQHKGGGGGARAATDREGVDNVSRTQARDQASKRGKISNSNGSEI